MRVFFLGATRFSVRCLEAVERSGQELVGCAGTPEHFSISYAPGGVRNVSWVDFAALARERRVPCVPYRREDPGAFRDAVAALRPDLLLVAGWYYMVPRTLRETARLGAVGLHGSLLPRYRGGAPLVWQIIHGEKEAGISLFHLENGVDTGDVIGAQAFPIEQEDTIADAMRKMEEAGVALLERWLPRLADGTAPRVPQDAALATEFPQRSPADGEIDWSWPAGRIRDFIRAQTRPYPGAFTILQGKKVTLWDADVVELPPSGKESS